MLKTPQVLQEQYGIPADAGRTRTVPRSIFAFDGTGARKTCKRCRSLGLSGGCGHTVAPHKSEFLSTMLSLIMSGSLRAHGEPRDYNYNNDQEKLASMSGLGARTTLTRRLGIFRPLDPVEVFDSEGKQIEARRSKRAKALAPVVMRKRRYCLPNMYAYLLPEGRPDKDPKKRNRYMAPSVADLLEHPDFSGMFRRPDKDAGERGFKLDGSKDLPYYIFHEDSPLSENARLVLSAYMMAGICDPRKKGDGFRGIIKARQANVAEFCGLSISSVYKANCELESFKIIRVCNPKPRRENGDWVRGPAQIVYLPIRTFTHEECVEEADRLLAAKKRLSDPGWWDRAVGIHTALLRAWSGQEHSWSAFYHEFHKQMKAVGAPKRVILELLPQPPS